MQNMSKDTLKVEKDIERSLERLKITFNQANPASSLIPPFFYSATLLNNYAKTSQYENINSNLFSSFKTLIEKFASQDFSAVTKNGQMIVDEILQIVDSELFMNCLNPQLKSYRDSLLEYNNNGQQQSAHKQKQGQNKDIKSLFAMKKQAEVNSQSQILWQDIVLKYGQHNLDEAYSKSQQYLQKVSKTSKISQQRLQFMKVISQEYVRMTDYYEEFDKPGWTFDKEENGITVEYKVYEQQKTVAIRIYGEFDIPVDHFVAIVSEIDLMGYYVPFCYDCQTKKIISRNSRIGMTKIYIPLITDRYTYFYAVGYDRISVTNSIFLYSKTITDDLEFQKKVDYKVQKETQYVNLQYKFFVCEYIPISKTRAKIRLCSKIDMKMNFLPFFIINKSARIFAFDYFKNILQICRNFQDSHWQKKIKENPELYDFFKQRIKERLGK